MTETPIIILGAGATKACGGPLTDEILPAALNGQMAHDNTTTLVDDREELLALTHQFLSDRFHVPTNGPRVQSDECPSLPMVLSMLRRAADLNQPIGQWAGERLTKARRALEYSIFAVIEAALRDLGPNRQFHQQLLAPLYQRNVAPAVVSLNYDVIVDNAMFQLGDTRAQPDPDG